MSQLAYVLIEAQVGTSRDMLGKLQEVQEVREAHIITGPYSLIAVLDAEDPSAIGRLVTERIHTIPGVLRTISCLALDR